MESLKLQQEEAKARQEEAKARQAEAPLARISGDSFTPSELAQSLQGQQVDPWFNPISWDSSDPLLGSFPIQVNPAQPKERPVQAAWLPMFSNVFTVAAMAGVHWWDGSACKWLIRPGGETFAPDGVAVADHALIGGQHPVPQLVLALHDNKKPVKGKFSNEDKGRLFRYCVIILTHYQSTRAFMPCSLFDGQYAQCFRVHRTNSQPMFQVDYTRMFDLKKKEDQLLYAGFLSDRLAMSYHLERLHPFAGTCIGTGATSLVFEHTTNADAVIKIPHCIHSELLVRERFVYLQLREMGVQSIGLPQLCDADSEDRCLVLQPKFQCLQGPIDVSRLCSLINADAAPLRILHTHGCVHCDVRPPNIMGTSDLVQLALVDLGAARFKSEAASLFDHGTVVFASKRVRTAHFSSQPIVVEPCDDLVSLVQCATVFMFDPSFSLASRTESEIQKYWDRFSNHKFFVEGIAAATAVPPKYDELCGVFRSYLNAADDTPNGAV
jgi:hypothetical protein